MPHKRTKRMWTPKYLRERCYHRIECFVTNFLATLIWRRPLNSVVLTIPTHKGPERMFDETSTRVVAWMINKWRANIIRRELYNVRNPWQTGDQKRERERTVAIKIVFVICSIDLYLNLPPWTMQRVNLFGSILLVLVWLSFKPILSIIQLIRGLVL